MAMTKSVALSEAELLRCLVLLGPPPILSSEIQKDFEEIFRLVAQCVQPHNMVEVIYLWHFVCASWFIKRYGRHAALVVERHAQNIHAFQVDRAGSVRSAKRGQEVKEVQKLTQNPPDVAHLLSLQRNVDGRMTEIDAIFEDADLERDHNMALQRNIGLQEQLNTLIISQTAIRNDSLRQLEIFRMGLGQLASEATEKILEGNCKEVAVLPHTADAPSITTSDDANSEEVSSDDDKTQDRSESAQ
jgi:hypothetical protein